MWRQSAAVLWPHVQTWKVRNHRSSARAYPVAPLSATVQFGDLPWPDSLTLFQSGSRGTLPLAERIGGGEGGGSRSGQRQSWLNLCRGWCRQMKAEQEHGKEQGSLRFAARWISVDGKDGWKGLHAPAVASASQRYMMRGFPAVAGLLRSSCTWQHPRGGGVAAAPAAGKGAWLTASQPG